MHTFLIAAISIDGFIAEKTDQVSTSWTSKEDKKFFSDRTKQAGVVVMGSSTYKTVGRPLPGRLNVVYSRNSDVQFANEQDGFVTNLDPAALLRKLEQEGYSEVAICGGASIYTLFLHAGLIDTLYLTVEPVIFGTGVKLFSDRVMTSLSLQKVEKLADNTLLLEYSVKRS